MTYWQEKKQYFIVYDAHDHAFWNGTTFDNSGNRDFINYVNWLALTWGVLATWWVGVLGGGRWGVALASAARRAACSTATCRAVGRLPTGRHGGPATRPACSAL